MNECTFQKRLKEGHASNSLGQFTKIFNKEQEAELVKYIWDLNNWFCGLMQKLLRWLAYQYAKLNNIPTISINKLKQLGKTGIMVSYSNKLSMKTLMQTRITRIVGFNKYNVKTFFMNYIDFWSRYGFEPSQIYNVNESGFTVVPTKTAKVISNRGKNLVGKAVLAECGQLITMVLCVNAVGTFIPPAFIFLELEGNWNFWLVHWKNLYFFAQKVVIWTRHY